MVLTIEIPEDVRIQLETEWGDVSRAAKEALAIESYRTGRISLGLLAEMLSMGVIEADRWLADRGVPLLYSAEDLAADCRALADQYPEMRT